MGSYVGDSFGCFLLVIDYFVKEKKIQLIIFEEVLKGNMKMENLENGNSLLCLLRKILFYFIQWMCVFLLGNFSSGLAKFMNFLSSLMNLFGSFCLDEVSVKVYFWGVVFRLQIFTCPPPHTSLVLFWLHIFSPPPPPHSVQAWQYYPHHFSGLAKLGNSFYA